MFRKFSKRFPTLFVISRLLFFFTIKNLLFPSFICAITIQVTNTDGGAAGVEGSLNSAIQLAQDGDIIDCSPIAGQTIGLTSPLSAIGGGSTSPTIPVVILGNNVIIDGNNAHTVFALAQGSVIISDFTIENGASQGAGGGSGKRGGGGGTAGGGALYIHSGTTMTVSTLSLNNNQAIGGNGASGSTPTGGAGGGGGGFGGGPGGFATRTAASAGSGGGGGGNSGGVNGGRDGANGSPNIFSNFGGAGGGGEFPGTSGTKSGGAVAASEYTPAHAGGAAGVGSVSNGAGGGGGAGSGGSGFAGSNAIDATSPGTGIGGAGGHGLGTGNTYGAGGGGGGGNGGGAGFGASGGGGGLNGPGGAGGVFGGGGGASGTSTGGNGGFGAGGGAGNTGGIDTYGLGGSGGSSASLPAGGGGGSGLGGAIFIQQGGTLIMQDGISFYGNSTTAGTGGSAASSGSAGGNGSSLGQDIFIQSGGSITFDINDALTLTTPIEGAGLLLEAIEPGLTKSGTGTINLAGINSYLGDTLIQSGTLKLNGSVAGDMHIESSGTLSGNATAYGNIYNYGTLSPGNSIGTIFTTDLYLYPTSVYNVEINSAGDSDLISASGFAQIDGGVVVSPDDLNFTTPLTYTIITTGTGVTGEFSSLTSSVPSLMSLIYNPLNVQLTYLPLDAIGLTGNAFNAASSFITISPLPGSDAATVNDALLVLSFNDMQNAFQQMGPAQFSGPTEVQLLDAILVRSTYTKHLQKLWFNQDLDCGQPMSLWIDGFAQWQNQDNLFGYNDTTAGATIGFDYHVHNWVIGSALSSTYDNFHWKEFAGNANINSFYAGLYARWNYDEFYMNLAILGACNKYKTTRHIDFGTINRYAYSQHNGNELLAHAGFEYWINPSHCYWTPYINLDCVMQHEHSYTETGADSLDLHVNPKKSTLFQGEVGISLSSTYDAWNGVLIPMLTLAYINQTPCSSKNYYANFVDSSDVFIGVGGDYKRNLVVSRLALMYQGSCDRPNISIYYDGQINNNYWAQDIVFDLTFPF